MIKTILVTGSAGFIGSALVKKLLEAGDKVIGIDNHNHYYDPSLKEARLALFKNHPSYTHLKIDISDKNKLFEVFEKYNPEILFNLAAQAGVRYSIDNPEAYINSNLIGFFNILEACKNFNIEHLIYASSSSVYGNSLDAPSFIDDTTSRPLSLYAATKKSNELLAHSYSNLYQIPTTGLRFFTVYGPWGRPDMAFYKFTKSILNNEPIKVYNNGKNVRDFTFIDDVIDALMLLRGDLRFLKINNTSSFDENTKNSIPWRIYNIGSNKPISLNKYIKVIEKTLGRVAKKEMLPMQPGDVLKTHANIDDFINDFNFKPKTNIDLGIEKFVNWYKSYYQIKD